jgi:hypothetical protein
MATHRTAIPARRDWLKRATQQSLICRSGSGYSGDASRYWLP